MSLTSGPDSEVECRLVLEHSDFVMQNHRVHGVSVMPGVTFLDIVLRILQAQGFDTARAELRNVLFHEAVATTEGNDREIRVIIAPPNEGVRLINAESRWRQNGTPISSFRRNFQAELAFYDVSEPPPIDLDSLRRSAVQSTDMDEMYARARAERIVHGDAMRCFGQLHYGPGQLLAELTLDTESARLDSDFLLHPAKMDCSTIAAFTQVDPADDDPFIPVFIERFRAPNPIRGKVYAHIPQPETLAPTGDVMHNSYGIHDADGRLLAEFTKLTCKRIRNPELIGRLLADTVEATTPSPGEIAPSPVPDVESNPVPMNGSGTVTRLRGMVATRLGKSPEEIPAKVGFYDLGLDSGHMLQMSREIEDLVGSPLYPTLLFEFSDIDSLAAHLDERYPLTTRPTPALEEPPSSSRTGEGHTPEASALLCYRPVWSASPVVVNGVADIDREVLVLIGADGTLTDSVGHLTGAGRVVRVERAEHYERVSPWYYRLDPAEQAHLDTLCAELAARGDIPSTYVRISARSTSALQEDAVPLAHRECEALATAITTTRPIEPVALLFLHEATAEGDARPEEAAVAALARTITAEVPTLCCRAVGYESGLTASRTAELIVTEVRDRSEASEVRHRGHVREAVRYQRQALPTAAPMAGAVSSPLRERGVYLITGGSGGLGGLLADMLARDLRARLVLMGRSAPSTALEERIRHWRALGAEVVYLPGDVARVEDVTAVVTRTRTLFGRIDGVFHCAGAVRDGMFFRKDESAVAEVLAAKVHGTRNLDVATADDEPDFLVLFSSLSATLANPGQSDYAYANAYLEHFAEWRVRRGRPGATIALGWPLWAEGGMRVADDVLSRSTSEIGLHPMPTDLGLDALLGVLAGGSARLVLPYGEPERVAAWFPEPAAPTPLPTLRSEPTPAVFEASTDEPVAIIGVEGRYPGADGLDEYWHNLVEGRDCVTEVPADRWDHEALYDEEKGRVGRTYGRWGGFLNGVDRFDAAFFGISRREAERMDPQERLFLTTSWRAIEDAGYRPDALGEGRVGVFAGVMWNHYQLLTDRSSGVAPTALHCSVANRVSYCLDFRGPSMAIDTACSSSLTAIHLAVESLRRGECAAAVAGGVNVSAHPQKYLQLAEGRFLSEDGRCRSFGEGGTGYVPGEGVGAVVLKPLSRALADGDSVYAVIRGSSLNHSGRTSGFTVPSPAAQATLIREAVDRSGMEPATIGYIEAHGTGTSLGDPIEIEGLNGAFADADLAPGTCAVGSVKSSIGHLESAAGIAAVTKVLLQMKHRRLAPSLHADRLNPFIDFASSPFQVQREPGPWKPAPGSEVLRAGVSAFGAGGANAHVLLESAPRTDTVEAEEDTPELFIFSARDRDTLTALLRRQVRYLAEVLEGPMETVALDGARTPLIIGEVARILGVPEDEIDPREPLADLGVDGIGLAELARRLSDRPLAFSSGASVSGDESIIGLAERTEIPAPHPVGPPPAAGIAYTLQVGRVALPVRAAVVACGLDDLRRRLEAHLADNGEEHGLYTGNEDELAGIDARDDASQSDRLATLLRSGDLHQVARRWVAGAHVSWESYYDQTGHRPRRISLPVHPFNEKRYWVGEWHEAGNRHAAPNTTPSTDSTPSADMAPLPTPRAPVTVREPAAPGRDEVTGAVEDALCAELYLEPHEIDARNSFHDLGLDSVGAVRVTQRLGEQLSLDIEPIALFDHPTVPRLTDHILALGPSAPAVSPAGRAAPGEETTAFGEDIAVIGMSGRFPGAENLDEFWENIAAGRDGFTEVPPQRWAVDPVYDPDRRAVGRTYSKWAAMLPDVNRFDAGLFNTSPLEAEVMDPQQRLFLQESWSALDDAGYAIQSGEQARCGVFVGCAPGDYSLLLAEAGQADGGHAFLGTTSSIMPARIGYLLNLVGPTMAVDTACSSSLVAVHLAAESIRRGECDMAVAGGVALMVTPQLHVRASKVGMLSPTGRCVPFDASADGTVLGEGVGCVVLKRLDQAIADGDHVHGVIKASGINGDGRTNGITAPSAGSQAALLAEVHDRAGVTAEHIGYVEAHGTGTPLGDPIEAKALTEVFRRTTSRTGYCGLGTVKSNIGHTTMAAGIAGLLKVLLALRHGELPPSPSFETPNPKTGLESSPFFIVRERRPWDPGPLETRVATVSSFGFSGTNAHAVVAEAPRLPVPPEDTDGEHLVVVSARDVDTLDRALTRLADALSDDVCLRDVAFTLAVGRTHWPVRIAFLSKNLTELRRQLLEAARGGVPVGCLRGDVRRVAPRTGETPSDQGSTEPRPSARRTTLERLAREYVSGQDLDRTVLFEGKGARRVPLPPYPFADERHWVELPQPLAVARPDTMRHPFIETSKDGPDSADGVMFNVDVPDDHWLLEHHRVGGRPVLPGAASLDLVVASAHASALTGPLELTGVRWLRPMDAGATEALRLRLTPTDDGYDFALTSGDAPEPYARGGLSVSGASTEETLDVTALADRCPHEVSTERFYEDFRSGGIEYGTYFQVLARVSFGEDEALGRFSAVPAKPGFALDPCLLDGAQQLIAAVEAGNDATLVPFSLDKVTILVPDAVPVYAHVERAGKNRYRIRLAEESGRVCVRYEGLSLRARHNPVDEMVYRPVWRDAAPVETRTAGDRTTAVVHTANAGRFAKALAAQVGGGDHVTTVELPDTGEVDLGSLASSLDVVYFVAHTSEPHLAPEQDTTALALFRMVKRFIVSGRTRDRLELRIVTAGAVPADVEEPVVPHAAGLLGLARAVEAECPRWRVSCVDVGTDGSEPTRTAARIVAEPGTEPLVLLRGERRLERAFESMRLPAPEGIEPFRRNGVYVIAGGAGGIGFALSRLLARIAKARLVWLGRSPRGAHHDAKVEEIAALGGRAVYLQADVADEAALHRAMDRVRAEFGAVHGAVHAALDLQDRTIANMDETTFTAGLAPKVDGITAFARVVGGEPLDFMVVFSSAVSFVEAGGQANYAAASTFEDAYVQWLDRVKPYPVSVVNWGFWGSVGAVANDRMREAFAKLGIGSIEPAEGMAVLRRVISARLTQVLTIKADRAALPAMGIHLTGGTVPGRNDAASSYAVPPAAPQMAVLAVNGSGSAASGEAVRDYVARVFAEVLKSSAHGLDPDATFENFGVDSLVSLNIIDRFEQDLGDLPSTLLFEYMTIDQLAAYFHEEYGERLTGLLTTTDGDGPVSGERATSADAPLPVDGASEPQTGTDTSVLDQARVAFAEVETFSRDLVCAAFHQMAGRPTAGERRSITDLEARIGVVDRHRRLFHAVLDILRAAGAVRVGDDIEFTGVIERPGPLDDGAELAARHPTMAGHVRLIERCVGALPDVLAGRRNPMDVLFPKGSVVLVEPIYRGQPIADHFNHILANEVADAARRVHERTGRPARVLEVGAGTGASSRTVLAECAKLGGDAVRYVYTDISPAFLRHGEREFDRAHPFMSFELLDISKDPRTQGFQAGDFDIVLGTHVLHATSDIERTLAHIGTLLRHGGLALVNEITRVSDFLTLTFGLTTGWWMYEDAERRLPHAPLLSPEQWRKSAESVDLTVPQVHGVPGAAEGDSAQSLVVIAKPEETTTAGEPKPVAATAASAHVQPEAMAPGSVSETQALPSAHDPLRSNDIAIIGVTGRYPQSPDMDTFWANVSQGNNCITEIPEERWDWRPHFDERKGAKHRTYNRWGGFLKDVDTFDAPLFGILPREANDIDPQERLFLETCWELLETTGYLGEQAREPRTGVFAGLMYGEYGLLSAATDWPEGRYATGHSAYWSMANRVSYTFDLQGPSLALDSACSSALTAVHLACESLRRRECRMAIAGGANLILHPAHFAALAARNMLSTGDGCRVFDAEADGFVPGEGVGAVLLKPLEEAEADGDTIWAVVKGSLSNAGGKVSGYTVPNPNAQAQLIEETLRRSGVHPRTVSYVEAHGTGTALGDPIEVSGLTRAFRSLGATDTDFCGVGSVKSNIGHLEGAAGIAALTKVLLQFRHRTIAPTINLDTVNPKIRFSASPFRPQWTATPWERPVADIGTGERTWPRRAGISSFGAGGANVHMVLEEYVEPGMDDLGGSEGTAETERQVFVLSALSQKALRTHAANVADFLRGPTGMRAPLRDLAATSQTGRRELPERLAVVGGDHAVIAANLSRFAEGETTDDDLFTGTVVRGGTGDKTPDDAPESGVAGRRPDVLARRWVRGGHVDWRRLWSEDRPNRSTFRKVAFPTYPFERRRHWIDEDRRVPVADQTPESPDGSGGGRQRHDETGRTRVPARSEPDERSERSLRRSERRQEAVMSTERTTTIEQRVTHPALDLARHHRIDGTRSVPGVALLELVREAFPDTDGFPLRMTGIRWISPVDLDAGTERVSVTFAERENPGTTAFQVFALGPDGRRLAAQGALTRPGEDVEPPVEEALDLSDLRRRYSRRIRSVDFYETFAHSGLRYGRPLKVVADLWVGDGEALARLANGQRMRRNSYGFLLNPALLDGALQAVSSLCDDDASYLPIGIAELRVHGPLPMDCWAQVREVTPTGRRNGHRRFDIRLTDGDGRLLQALDGLEIALRSTHLDDTWEAPDPPVIEESSTVAPPAEGTRVRYLRPVWEPAPRITGPAPVRTVLLYGEEGPARSAVLARLLEEGATVVPVSDGDGFARADDGTYTLSITDPDQHALLVQELAERDVRPDAIVRLADDVAHRTRVVTDTVTTALSAVLWSSVAVLRSSERSELRVLYVHTGTFDERALYDRAVGGTLRTLALEHTRFCGVRLTLQPVSNARTVDANADLIVEELLCARAGAVEIDQRDGVRYAKDLRIFEPEPVDVDTPRLRDGGTYLITGGTGAIGLHFARFLADSEQNVTIVLTGRSVPDGRLLEGLNDGLAQVVYRRADLRDPEATRRLVDTVTAEFGPLRGVIHSAGVNRDSRAVRKTPEEVAAVLGPKVSGTVHLDSATADEPLDFFVLFSSMAAEAGNPGQADYAYANSFLNEFAAYRSDLVESGDRSGASLSICWPLWADGGMEVDDATRDLFARKWDMVPMSTGSGLEAFGRALASGEPCCAVVEGLAPRTPEAAVPTVPEPTTVSTPPSAEPSTDARHLAEREARSLAARFLMVDEADVDVRVELLELGFDSITLTELVNSVNDRFGLDLLPTVLFEYPDLASFADYLAEHHHVELLAALPDQEVRSEPDTEPVSVSAADATPDTTPDPGIERPSTTEPPTEQEDTGSGAIPEQARVNAAEERVEPTPVGADHPIAVIGMAGVFPESADLDAFWEHLVAGDDLVGPVPRDRAALVADPVTRGMRGGFLDAVDAFDARLFGISPNEAALMDPQQRLFLQSAWRSIEDAGYRPSDLAGSATGLFVGVATHDYDDLLKEYGVESEAHAATGIAHSVLPNRVSYLLDLRGPSEAVDTACSSSLVSLHRAVRSLRDGECDQAVAGGVNVILSPGLLRSFSRSGMLSDDGRCKTFDVAADGYVRGEGAGAVVLKPLEKALADGDVIHAVIRGSAVNHGGRAASLTAPNPDAQARVIAQAVRTAGVAPDTVTYIETHGTGTRLGDPIEIEGLKKAFAQLHEERGEVLPGDGSIALGAVKSVIGHVETAAGIAGVLKVLLCMRHRMLPANLHFTEPNPYLRLGGSPFRVNDRLRAWEPATTADGRRVYRAGVSSFGFGGSNAHVLLEAYESGDGSVTDHSLPMVVPLSAGSPEDLAEYAGRLARHLQARPEADLIKTAYTLQTGRAERPHRFAVPVRDRDELIDALSKFAAGRPPAGAMVGTAARGVSKARGDEDPGLLAKLWCEGAAVPWGRAWVSPPDRLSLPTSPFARTRHWVDSLRGGTGRRPELQATIETDQTRKESSVPSTPEGPQVPSPVGRGPKVRLAPLAAKTAGTTPAEPQTPPFTTGVGTPPLPGPPAASHSVPGNGTPAAIAALLREQLANILGMAATDIGGDIPFADLGLDSIYRMDLVRLLNTTFSLDLKAAELYDYDTVTKLAEFVAPLCEGQGSDGVGVPDTEAASTSGAKTDDLRDLVLATLEQTLGRPIDPGSTFADNGFTSFDMLRSIAALEKGFGALRKTLLFDHPTVPELAAVLEPAYRPDTARLLSGNGVAVPATPRSADSVSFSTADRDGAVVIEKACLGEEPEIAGIIAELERRYGREGGLPGRDIAPLIFLGADRTAYFNFSRRGDVMLTWSYVGPTEYMPALAAEYVEYGRAHGVNPNIVSLIRLEEESGVRFTATPFGALQRIENITDFSLDGGRMARLRYIVRKFEKAGHCRTVEYEVGSEPETDQAITRMIDQWSQAKEMVNPYVFTVRDEIGRGVLQPRHRMFLTYVDDRMVNAVIVTKIPSEPGYLLDLEFYPRDAPLGGLDYAVVEIIGRTAAEGCTVFSFGGSFGAKICDSPNAAPEAEVALEELRSQDIFTGDGNFRFKNKFRPENHPLYLCQPVDSPRTDVSELILMIADPDVEASRPTADPTRATTAPPVAISAPPITPASAVAERSAPVSAIGWGTTRADTAVTERERQLAAHGWNPLHIPADQVDFDLVTDSWAEQGPELTAARTEQLRRQAFPLTPGQTLEGIDLLPFSSVVPAPSGRMAETALCQAWPSSGPVVIHNSIFPTWYFSLLDRGYQPVEVRTAPDGAFRGDLDLDHLEALLAENAARIAFLCVETSTNAGGGAAISLTNLAAVRELADRYDTRLVLDATRVLDNAVLVAEYESGHLRRDPFDVAQEILVFADAVTMSLSKNFGTDTGGIVATDDPLVAHHLQERIGLRGPGVGRSGRALATAALTDHRWAVNAVRDRVRGVARLHQALTDAGLPTVPGVATHCVLLDTARMPSLRGFGQPAPAVLAWIYQHTGIRAAIHLSGGREGAGLIRLAVPVGLDESATDMVADRLTRLFAAPSPVRDLLAAPAGTGPSGTAALAHYHPVDHVPDDIRDALDEGHMARNDNSSVLREHAEHIEHSLLRSPDGEVEVWSAGKGPVLLLMSPFNIGAGVFGPQFAALTDRYKVIVVHHPGVGATTAGEDLTYVGLAALARRVLDELGIKERVHVAGASFGGLVAQMFALRYPDTTASLTLIGSSYKLGNRADEANRLGVVVQEDFDHVERSSGSSRFARERAGYERVLLRSESMDPQTGLRYLDVFATEPNLFDSLGALAVPTLIVQGRYDTVIPLKTAHLLHGLIPGSRYHEIADAGHFPSLTSADEFNDVLTGFLAEYPTTATPLP